MAESLLGATQSFLLHRPKLGFRCQALTCSSRVVVARSKFSETTVSYGGFVVSADRRFVRSKVVSSDSVAPTTAITNTVDSSQGGTDLELDTSGGGGDLGGGRSGGGGGGGDNSSGGGSDNKGKGESGDSDKKKMGMSMSQKLTLGYAALVGVGGVMGYLKTSSQKSLLSGGLSAVLLYYVYTELPTRPVLASSIGLGVSAALLGVMGTRFRKSGKIFPAGVVSFVSLVMTGGYVHGIMRSMH